MSAAFRPAARLGMILVAAAVAAAPVAAQDVRPADNRPVGNIPAAGQQPNVNAAFADPGAFGFPGGGPGAQGGSASADFDSLIDLITATVERDSWMENGTGEGDIQPFAINGVYVDAAGAVRVRAGAANGGLAGARLRGAKGQSPATPAASARAASPLRFVSLPKLEAAIADCQRRHAPLDSAMLSLAGLQRVSYVFVYPETGDLVLAGPAGDWQASPGGGLVLAETGRPLVRLDDLLSLWRRQRGETSAAFGCSIVPRQEALAKTQEYLAASAAEPITPGQRRQWLEGLRATVGVQDVEYYHIDPESRIAALLFFADYHMKLVGMGLADGVPGVNSYLNLVRVGPQGQPPAMSVLRWWFSMPQSTVEASADHDAFAMPERCVEVLSENELLAARGERVHTGQSEELNTRFARSFTENFAALAEKYPVYGELERVFELSLALALIEREGLAEKAGWAPGLLLDGERLGLPRAAAPRTVETVINHRVIGGRHIIAGVSGGVWLDGGKKLAVSAAAAETSAAMTLAKKRPKAESSPAAAGEPSANWWWD